ncbi:hypothetical protein QVD17_29575 [Tagetes erecta]|uniref:Uncharacterized protein n=1 Tax=Tagetes erecta TaxID=13708 RepID=A0AAD8NLE3_TARER|nr:hypothetical protein QVD17_29575 [Tagetes erecta]
MHVFNTIANTSFKFKERYVIKDRRACRMPEETQGWISFEFHMRRSNSVRNLKLRVMEVCSKENMMIKELH